MKKIRKAFLLYIFLMCLYILLSTFGVFSTVFGLNDLGYKKSYIFRQGYVLFSFSIIFSILIAIYKNRERALNLLTNRKLYIAVWFVLTAVAAGDRIGLYSLVDLITQRSLMFALASLIYLLKPSGKGGKIIFLITILTQISLLKYSSTVLALLVAGCMLLLFGTMLRFARTNFGMKFYALLCLLIIVMASIIENDVVSDMNTMWRWQYWMNEMKLLLRTGFMGVGFGTAYASNSILYEINNIGMLVADGGKGMFYVTQHSSLINSLYRMGVIGAIAFVNLFLIHPIRWGSRIYHKVEDRVRRLIKWGMINVVFDFIICITNPGFESPRFYIGFMIPFSIYLGVLYIVSEEIGVRDRRDEHGI